MENFNAALSVSDDSMNPFEQSDQRQALPGSRRQERTDRNTFLDGTTAFRADVPALSRHRVPRGDEQIRLERTAKIMCYAN